MCYSAEAPPDIEIIRTAAEAFDIENNEMNVVPLIQQEQGKTNFLHVLAGVD